MNEQPSKKDKGQPKDGNSKVLLHLPVNDWPETDRQVFEAAFASGDIFDDNCPPGAHLSEASRRKIESCWRRFLGWLKRGHPDAFNLGPADRITNEFVKGFIEDLQGQPLRMTTIVSYVDGIYQAARLIAPDRDWAWLAGVKRRLHAQAEPLDRFDRLVTPAQTLELGIQLMEAALKAPPRDHKLNEIQYRNGLILALLSLWPIRRRSMAALTVDRHIERFEDRINLLLFAEDTKGKRAEAITLHQLLVPYLEHYLDLVRPILMRNHRHTALWVSQRGTPLGAQAIYHAVRKHIEAATGKPMGLHDFRRSAGTHLAIESPELIGILPGVLSHADPKTSERHYNLARSETASRRYTEMMKVRRRELGIARNRKREKTLTTNGERK